LVRATINSEKHIVQHALSIIPVGTTEQLTVVSVSGASPVTADQVRIGAEIKAVFIELWLVGDANQVGQFILTVEKNVASSAGNGFGGMAVLNAYVNKKNILFTSQGVLGDNNTNPVPVLRQWIAIPKGKQRFGQGDSIIVTISAVVGGVERCGVSIFKERY